MVAEASPTIRRSCCEACDRMVRGPAPRLRYSSPATYPSTNCRALSSASPSEPVGKNAGTWRWNDALLGVDGPRLATGGRGHACRHQQCECTRRPVLVQARLRTLESRGWQLGQDHLDGALLSPASITRGVSRITHGAADYASSRAEPRLMSARPSKARMNPDPRYFPDVYVGY